MPLPRRGGSSASDAEVIRASHERPEQFADLFDRHAVDMHRYLSARVGPSDADDLLSETFLTAFTQRGHYDTGKGEVRAWLFGIATNLVSRRHRRRSAWQRVLGRLSSERAVDGDDERVSERVDAGQGYPAMRRALAALPAGQREVLLLFAWADLDYAGIAQALGVPVGTVRSRLNRARTKVRAVLADDPAAVSLLSLMNSDSNGENRS